MGIAKPPPRRLSKRVQKRIAAGYLVNEMGFAPDWVAKLTGFVRADQVERWAAQLADEKHCEDNGAARGPARAWRDEHVETLADALEADPTGVGVGRISQQLHRDGKLPPLSEESWRRALHESGYACQQSVSSMNGDRVKRKGFCVKVRNLALSSRGAFTDSKIFAMGGDYKAGRPLKMWAKAGQPRERSRAKPTHKARQSREPLRFRKLALISVN